MKVHSIKVVLLASVFLLHGCGGNDDPDPDTGTTGIFLDSPIVNVNYKTVGADGVTTREGSEYVTDVDGVYKYTPGEKVTFSIGSLVFPEVVASGTVTPLDLAETSDPNNQEVVNILRLLHP